MAAEREAFGFYFSAHPVDSHRHLLAAYKVRHYGELGELNIPDDGSRGQASMAGLVEDIRWRTSAKGRRYMMATLSDSTGQFMATAFDDDVCKELEDAARSNACGLVTVELDRRPGDELPRVSIRRFQALEARAKRSRLQMSIDVADQDVVRTVCRELDQARGGTGIVRLTLRLADGRQAVVVAGRDFRLDAEVAARIERVTGEGSVDLSVQEPPKLALVG
jgi:DNA polymerase-3 subunit alpha